MRKLTDKPSADTNLGRRRFLRVLGLGTAAAGAVASTGHVAFTRADSRAESPTADRSSVGYQEIDHVRAFYATLRD